MDMTIDQQVALDEALAPHTGRLRIGKSDFHLRSDITSKEGRLRIGKSDFHLRSDITSKEGDLKRLRIHDIEDMLLLLV
nr:hypothetical protein [Tanacetum cinerariifolium]